ncbi:MAG: DUF4440 domain-containing protein [Gemmatimonadaceae bacterium]
MKISLPTSIRLSLVSLFAAMLVALQPLPAQQRDVDTTAVIASAHAEIDAANAAWLPGMKKRDAAAIVAAYADSGIFVGPNGSVVRGRAAVEQMYEGRFGRLRTIFNGGIVQEGRTAVAPDLIYEWGHGWLEMVGEKPDAAPVRSGGRYLTVWKREADGHWRIVRNLSL